MRKLLLALLLVSLLAGCASSRTYTAAHNGEPPATPKKILLLPPEVRMLEVTAGGIAEIVEEWSKKANENLIAALKERVRTKQMFEIVEMPALSPEEQEILDQHTAMYEVVASNAYQFGMLRDDSWTERSKELNYTVGSGLRFLADETGADAALFIVGFDSVSTTGRRLLFVVTTIMFGLPVIPPGLSYVAAGLVDLRSGKLLWQSYDYGIGRLDLRDPADVQSLTASVLETYPNGATFK
jgi:hypothetical protein